MRKLGQSTGKLVVARRKTTNLQEASARRMHAMGLQRPRLRYLVQRPPGNTPTRRPREDYITSLPHPMGCVPRSLYDPATGQQLSKE